MLEGQKATSGCPCNSFISVSMPLEKLFAFKQALLDYQRHTQCIFLLALRTSSGGGFFKLIEGL